eukprot:2430179-Amphidinium_carterae.1
MQQSSHRVGIVPISLRSVSCDANHDHINALSVECHGIDLPPHAAPERRQRASPGQEGGTPLARRATTGASH